MPVSITITNLSKTFPASGRSGRPHRALDDVSLHIPSGALFFLLGPSGCGKTTLLRTLAGFTEPDAASRDAPSRDATVRERSESSSRDATVRERSESSSRDATVRERSDASRDVGLRERSSGRPPGTIHFGERDVTRVPPEKRNAAMVFQSYALWPHLSVEQNVEFGLRARKVARAERKRRVAHALDIVRLGALARRKPAALSGGQQQRVALARALAVNPDVLLLDEPLSNLDARLRHEMRDEISRVVREAKLTAVYVTHDQAEALSMADQVAVMLDGRVLQTAPPTEIYRRPNSPAVADIVGPTNYIVVDADSNIQTKAKQRWMVRPESLTVRAVHDGLPGSQACAASVAGAVQVEAKALSAAFLGANYEIGCETLAGERVRAISPRGDFTPGQRVLLSFDPAAACAFPA